MIFINIFSIYMVQILQRKLTKSKKSAKMEKKGPDEETQQLQDDMYVEFI
jgi:hypothetical protein